MESGGGWGVSEVFFFLGDEDLAWIDDAAHSLIAHLIDPELGRTSKTIFQGTQYAVCIVAIAFKLKNGVDHVFEHFGSGDAAVFRDVSDEKYRNVRFFGEALEFGCAFPYL